MLCSAICAQIVIFKIPNYKQLGYFLCSNAFVYLCLFYPVTAHSYQTISDSASLLIKNLSAQEILTLSKQQNWRRLLKYRPKATSSQIISDDFFLAHNGSSNPHQELIKTLALINNPIGKNPDKHVICLFPARVFWLEKQLDLNFEYFRQTHCSRLNHWMKPSSLDSVSLLMVSGYFGNPASTYGHTIIKLNNGTDTETYLQDQSVNFGALIPENENTLVYILKGLFGGYTAGFSDRKFYTQDLVYTQAESRDMWEYELKLDKIKLKLLVYHLWELVGKKFTYYFLKENCAYHVTELLEIIYDKALINDKKGWYVPVETFYTLRDIASETGTQTYVSPKYIPSRKVTLYQQFEALPSMLQVQINHHIEAILNSLNDGTPIKTLTHNPIVMEFLLEYIDYKFHQPDGTYTSKVELLRSQLLLARLKLPKSTLSKKLAIPFLSPPSSGPRPHLFSPFIRYSAAQNNEIGLRFSPAYFDALSGNKGQLKNSDLASLETVLAINKNKGLYLDKLNFFRIKQLSVNPTKLIGEANHSWQLRTGLVRTNTDCFSCYTFLLEGGIGKSFKISNGLISYAMFTSYYSSAGSKLDAGANIGLLYQPKNQKLKIGAEFNLTPPPPRDNNPLLRLKLRYSLSKDVQISAEYEEGEDSSFMLSLNTYL